MGSEIAAFEKSETGSGGKRVYFPDGSDAWIYRDAQQLRQELADRWGEQGDAAAFRADEARVVAFLQEGYKTAVPPTLATAQQQLGHTLTQLWITGSAHDLLNHYFPSEQSKIYTKAHTKFALHETTANRQSAKQERHRNCGDGIPQ